MEDYFVDFGVIVQSRIMISFETIYGESHYRFLDCDVWIS